MTLIIFLLVLVGVAAGDTGSTTPGSTTPGSTTPGSTSSTFTPTSVCGIAALRCYSAQQQVMDDKFEAIDYVSACQYFKSIVVCMEHIGDCSTDPDFDVVRQQLLNDVDGICGIDGSIQICGTDVHGCFTTMEAGVTDALAKNFSAACPLIADFAACATRVATSQECPDSLVRKLRQMQQAFSTDETAMKCSGPCPLAIQACITNVTTMPLDHSILEVDLTAFCRSASKVYNCLNNLETNAACSTSSLEYLKTFVQNQLTKMRDVCNTDGTTTSCVSNLDQCAIDLLAISNHSDTATDCKSMSEFIECFSQLPCSTTLAPLIAIFRSRLETDEVEMECPSVGSCDDRWTKCGHQEQGLANVSSTDKQTICKTAKSGIKCFDFVKSDPLCINEVNGFITQEQSLRMVFKTKCGASSWLIQLPLLVAALLASLKQFF